MFGGADHVGWLKDFNANIASYAEENGKIQGAYGHRWRKHFGRDQIMWVVRELQRDSNSRQAVIGMYDPAQDYHSEWKDRPCNTHIYFRRVNCALDMTVCNRSNDVVWGMAGANIVHMTMLQQLIAEALNWPVGNYHVMTNNLHIYERHWDLLDSPSCVNHYQNGVVEASPILDSRVTLKEFLYECEMFCNHQDHYPYQSAFLRDVAAPMYGHYMSRLNGDTDTYDIGETAASDFQLFEKMWREWKDD